MVNFYIFVVATHFEGTLEALVESLEKTLGFNINNFKILGYGVKWENFNTKIQILLNALNKCNDDDIIISCDAYDVLYDFRKSFETLKLKFFQANKDLIFSVTDMSRKNIPLKIYYKKVFCGLDKFNNEIGVNGGTYIGKCVAMRSILEEMSRLSEFDAKDDERSFNIILNSYPYDDVGNSYLYRNFRIGLDLKKVFFNVDLRFSDNVYDMISNFMENYKVPKDTFDTYDSFFHHFLFYQDSSDLCRYHGLTPRKTYSSWAFKRFWHYFSYFKGDIEIIYIVIIAFIYFLFIIKIFK